jgi:flagellar hook-associated protein 2
VADTSRTTNEFFLADQGLHLSLKAPTSTDVTITATPPAIDKQAVKDKLKAFVDAYNDVITTINKHTTEKPVKDPTIGLDYEKGTLYGDAGLNGIVAALRKQATERIVGLDDPATIGVGEPDELLDIGISTGKGANGKSSEDAKLGKLVIDDAKLDAALTDPLAVKALFAGRGAVEGFSAAFDKVTKAFAGTSGTLEARAKGADDRVRAIRDQVANMEKRLEAKEKRYKAQFAAMEAAMGQAQTQSAWLASTIAGLPLYSSSR